MLQYYKLQQNTTLVRSTYFFLSGIEHRCSAGTLTGPCQTLIQVLYSTVVRSVVERREVLEGQLYKGWITRRHEWARHSQSAGRVWQVPPLVECCVTQGRLLSQWHSTYCPSYYTVQYTQSTGDGAATRRFSLTDFLIQKNAVRYDYSTVFHAVPK